MRLRALVPTCLAVLLVLVLAGCGTSPTSQKTGRPSVLIIAPSPYAQITATPGLPGRVMVKVSVSNFALKTGSTSPGSGEVWIYADGQIESHMASPTATIELALGTYTLKATLVTNGKVVASSVPVVVTVGEVGVANPGIANAGIGPSTQAASCTSHITSTTSGAPATGLGSIALFSAGLPPCSSVSGMVAGPVGDLWFTYAVCSSSPCSGGVGLVTPSGNIAAFSTHSWPSPTFTDGAGGTLWFTYQGGIGRVSASGVVSLFTTGLPANSFIGSLHPGSGGDLWFTDCIAPGSSCTNGTGAIGRITPFGQITMFSQGLPGPVNGMVLGSDGNMWFVQSDQVTNTTVAFGRITPSGQITMFSQGLPAGSASGLTLQPGPGGDLWFDGLNSNGQDSYGLGRVTPSGTITIFSQGLPANSGIGALLAGPGGDIWFPTCSQSTTTGGCVKGTAAIGQITPSGVITLFNQGLPAAGAPSDLILGQGGNMWFEFGLGGFARGCGGPTSWSDPIGVITPSGVITTFTQALPANVGISPLTLGSGGSLWFSECVLDQGSCSGRLSIGRISSSGTITLFDQGLPNMPPGASGSSSSSTSPYASTSPYSMSFLMQDSAGNLWFTYGNAIGEVTPSGAITVFSQGLPSGGYPFGFVTGSDGNLWFTENLNNSVAIGRLSL